MFCGWSTHRRIRVRGSQIEPQIGRVTTREAARCTENQSAHSSPDLLLGVSSEKGRGVGRHWIVRVNARACGPGELGLYRGFLLLQTSSVWLSPLRSSRPF